MERKITKREKELILKKIKEYSCLLEALSVVQTDSSAEEIKVELDNRLKELKELGALKQNQCKKELKTVVCIYLSALNPRTDLDMLKKLMTLKNEIQ